MKFLNRTSFNDNYSKGCQLCQEGKWICIFLTYLCNANCTFCPAPFKNVNKVVSDFGDNPGTIHEYIKNSTFKGMSFSGGDCFLVFDRLIEWLSFFKKHNPELYYWAYTNGLAADENKILKLACVGLDELRFNIAATNYNSPAILEKMSVATRLLNNVAVEIPSIPADYQKLVKVLPYLDSINVKYLNLHEYILVPDDPAVHASDTDTFILNKEMTVKYDVCSIKNTEKIKQFCRKHALKIQINHCSLQKKEVQMLHRRLTMGNIFKKDYEQLTQNGLLETYLVYPKKLCSTELQNLIDIKNDLKHLEQYFVHPKVFKTDGRLSTRSVAKLSLLPPMSLDGTRKLIRLVV